MGPVNGMNPAEVKYFPLEEYVDRIKIEDNVLFHLEDTNKEFDKYLRFLSQFDDYSVLYYWIDSLSNEIKYSQKIENHLINPYDMLKNNVFFDTLQMSHRRIKKLHQFVTKSERLEGYRSNGKEVRVSTMDRSTEEEIVFWRGANSEDIKKFMNDFISIYKSTSLSLLNSNPFLKSALVSLLFVRIHPFIDGNGRTSRMIYNIKFTDAINKIYDTKLKLCPLNLSHGIFMFKPNYARTINDIYFDLEHDSNDEINKWFNFVLDMIDEQLYFSVTKLPKLAKSFCTIDAFKNTDSPGISKTIEKMKIKYQ